MKTFLPVAAASFIAAFTLGAVAPDASAATKERSAYATKKAECTREAKAKKFGIHFVQRNRWIKDCIAGKRT